MAGKARTYKRDSNGRFASTGGGGSKRPAAKRVAKGPNRLTRDNSGRITSVGGDGATVRGGRLRTASGKQRGRQLASVKGGGKSAMNKIANRTGQSKTLNKFNSRPERTRGAYIGGRYVPKEKLKGRQPLDPGRGDDRAYARIMAKAAAKRRQAAGAKSAAGRTGAKGKGPSMATAKGPGVTAIPAGDLKRYRMLQNKIRPLRNALDRDASIMIGSADHKRRGDAAASYDLNNRRLKRVTDTMRRLSKSPNSPNIPRLPDVTVSGRRLGRTAAIRRMDGPRKFGGQSWRDLRGQYSQGRVQYDDNYMDKLYKRNKGQGIKRMPKVKGTISRPKFKPQAPAKQSRNQSFQNPRARVRGSATRLARKVDSERRLYQRKQVATQPTLFGGSDRMMSGLRFIGTMTRGGGIRKAPDRKQRTIFPAPGSPRAKRYKADSRR